ncbi:MAG: hypothetical protein WBO92_03205, partial [Candidatus Moraniibacteriota bacterium]
MAKRKVTADRTQSQPCDSQKEIVACLLAVIYECDSATIPLATAAAFYGRKNHLCFNCESKCL